MTSRLALRLRDDALAVIDVSPRARRELAEEAAFRRMSPGALAERVIEAAFADEDGATLAGLLDGKRERRRST